MQKMSHIFLHQTTEFMEVEVVVVEETFKVIYPP